MAFSVPQPGEVFEGRFRLLEQIGSGAFAAVYRAEQLEIGRIVAVKILLTASPAFDETTLERFRLEARTLSRLHHPNCLTMYDFGWASRGQPYLVTEYVPGKTLRALTDTESALRVPRALHITRQILYALRDAHNQGIVHRDMKPANVMVFDRIGERDVVKVLDFGIAKLLDFIQEEDRELPNLTLRGKLLGTPRYMAPELLCEDGVRPSTDLYSVGLMLYELLTGREAVPGSDPVKIITRQVGPDPIIEPDDPGIPDALRGVLAMATAKNIHARVESAQALLDALEAVDEAALVEWRPPRGTVQMRALSRANAPYSSGPRQARTGFSRIADAARGLVSNLRGNGNGGEGAASGGPVSTPEAFAIPLPEPEPEPAGFASTLQPLPPAPVTLPPAPLLPTPTELSGPIDLKALDVGWQVVDLQVLSTLPRIRALSRDDALEDVDEGLSGEAELEPVDAGDSTEGIEPEASLEAAEVFTEEASALGDEVDMELGLFDDGALANIPEMEFSDDPGLRVGPGGLDDYSLEVSIEVEAPVMAAAVEAPRSPTAATAAKAAPAAITAAEPPAPRAPAAPPVQPPRPMATTPEPSFEAAPPPDDLRYAEPIRRGGLPSWVYGAFVALALVGGLVFFYVKTMEGEADKPVAPPTGSGPALHAVTISTTPPGARVLEGARELGMAPVRIEVKSGETRTVRVELEGHQPVEQRVDGSTPASLVLALTPEAPPRAAPDAGAAAPDAAAVEDLTEDAGAADAAAPDAPAAPGSATSAPPMSAPPASAAAPATRPVLRPAPRRPPREPPPTGEGAPTGGAPPTEPPAAPGGEAPATAPPATAPEAPPSAPTSAP